MNEQEYQHLKAQAKKAGLGIDPFIRNLVAGIQLRPRPPDEVAALVRELHAIGNNAIAILKDSSLVSAIGLTELAYAARTVAGASARYWEPYLTISVMYWVATLGLAWLIHMLEKRLGKGDDK